MEQEKFVEVIEFTDPICTWCWGSEPLLRKLETVYKDRIKVKFVMGGLVEDIRDFYDSFNVIGGDVEQSNKQIAKHSLEASQRHGMPINAEGFNLFSNEHPSSYPQNIAYKAAQMENEELANIFLRKIREATELQSKQTSRTEVLIELASESGLDVSKFIERFTDGSAEAAFKEDLNIIKQYLVRGFPSFLVKYGDKKLLLRGYQNFDIVKSVIKNMTNDAVKMNEIEKTESGVLEFMKKYKSAAGVEIQNSFDFSDDEFENIIGNLINKNFIRKVSFGNGYIIELLQNPMVCDTETGQCNI